MAVVIRLNKVSTDVAPWSISFDNFEEVKAGQTISSPVLTISGSDSALTAGTPTITGTKVVATYTGGTAGIEYTLSCQVLFSGGGRRSAICYMHVR